MVLPHFRSATWFFPKNSTNCSEQCQQHYAIVPFLPARIPRVNAALFSARSFANWPVLLFAVQSEGDSLYFTWTNTGFFGIELRDTRFFHRDSGLLPPAFILRYLRVQCKTWWATAFPFRSTFDSCRRARITSTSGEILLNSLNCYPFSA
jgi:hypothetical protein